MRGQVASGRGSASYWNALRSRGRPKRPRSRAHGATGYSAAGVFSWLLLTGVLSAQVLTLEQAGWQALSAARYRVAAATFQKAIASEPRNARLHFGAGAASYLELRDAEAQDILAECTLSTGVRFAREQLRAWTGGHPAGQDAACVAAPVLMVTTDDQFFTAAGLAQEARRFATCELAHVPGAGHWPQLEQPQRLSAALSKFLAGIVAHPVRA